MHSSERAAKAGWSVLGASVGCVLLFGCAAAPPCPNPDNYVFFSHYPELRRVPAGSGVFLYANPYKAIRERDRFIVNPPQIGFQPQSGHWLSPADAQKWAELLRSEVIVSLSERYEVVDTPAADTLRVTSAIADIRLRDPSGTAASRDPVSVYQPFLIVLISDSDTGEGIVLVRDLNRGNDFVAAVQSDESAAREVLSDWARTLRERLEEVQGVTAEPMFLQPPPP